MLDSFFTLLPDSQDMILSNLSVEQNIEGETLIELDGLARNNAAVTGFVDALIASRTYIKPNLRRMEARQGDGRYATDFSLSVSLATTELNHE